MHDVWFDSVNVYDKVFSIFKKELNVGVVFDFNNAMRSGPFWREFLVFV